jgi:hypothetical protein
MAVVDIIFLYPASWLFCWFLCTGKMLNLCNMKISYFAVVGGHEHKPSVHNYIHFNWFVYYCWGIRKIRK